MQRRPRGTEDVLPPESARWRRLEAAARRVAERFGFREVRTPVFEHAELLARGAGEGSDVVEKEMYAFPDRAGRMLALRPESTAAVVRALVEAGRLAERTKLYYVQSHFRYERPDAGRLRQHHQFGVEFLGDPSPFADAEVVTLAVGVLTELGLEGAEVRLNSLGDDACRPGFRAALTAFLSERREALCADCRRRLETNPLRVLDCKVPGCVAARAGHPETLDHLCAACRAHFEGVQDLLRRAGVAFVVDGEIVRGLDYYSRTVFEIALPGAPALAGGGRYDGLAGALGAPPTPAVGFGLGVERLLAELARRQASAGAEPGPVVVAVSGDDLAAAGFETALRLRRAGVAVDYAFPGRSLRSQMRIANRQGSAYAVILGPAELAAGVVTVRRLADGEEWRLTEAEAVAMLRREAEGP